METPGDVKAPAPYRAGWREGVRCEAAPHRKLRQGGEKGSDARRRPKAAGEAYSLYVEPAAEGANEADGPLSAAC